jgi:hypothetical protein
MPKNFKPSFKNYVATPSSVVLNQEVGHDHDHHDSTDGLSVNERLARSRAEAARGTGSRRMDWNVDTSCMPLRAAWPDYDITNTNTTSIQPRRRAAGPSAPPSWRTPPIAVALNVEPISDQVVTRDDLINATALLGEGRINPSPVQGVQPLAHYIYQSVIQYLDCPDVYWIDEDGTTTTYGQFYRNDVRGYDEKFKMGILANHSSHSTPRLSDRSIKAILSPPDINHHPPVRSESEEDDWDTGPLTERIHHLGITLHPDPYRLLKSINPLPTVALTSLDLAYSSIPQVEKLVDALPRGLRELGMVGVRCTSEGEFTRMLGLLGKRLILLHVSLISSCPNGNNDRNEMEEEAHLDKTGLELISDTRPLSLEVHVHQRPRTPAPSFRTSTPVPPQIRSKISRLDNCSITRRWRKSGV